MTTFVEKASVSGRHTTIAAATSGLTYEVVFGGEGPEDVLVRTAGAATVAALSAMGSAVVHDPRFRPPLKMLIDHRRLDWRSMTAEDIRLRAERVLDAEAPRLAGCTLAIVAHDAAGFGIARMLWSQVEADAQIDFAVFATIEEARSWLAGAPT